MEYLEEYLLPTIFDLIGRHYSDREEVPDYRSEKEGIEKLLGVFQGARQDTFYATVLEKAVYILLQINKGHFFSNGNKRLSLICAIGFLGLNNIDFKQGISKENYRKHFSEFFPSPFEFEDYPDFSSEEFALYNLSIFIADSTKYGVAFEELKKGVQQFVERMVMPPKSL